MRLISGLASPCFLLLLFSAQLHAEFVGLESIFDHLGAALITGFIYLSENNLDFCGLEIFSTLGGHLEDRCNSPITFWCEGIDLMMGTFPS